MADQTIPEVDRRKKETGAVGHVVETLIGKQSRKVAFGIWLFLVATALLKAASINSDQWLKCAFWATLLIGFGTVLDEIILNFGNMVAGVAASKVKSIIETNTTTTVTTDAPPTPPTPGQ